MRLTRRLLLSSAALIPGAALAQPTLTTPHAPRWNQKRLYGPRAGKYGPQNLPTQGPSLSLDFTAGTLDPSITFTRATTGPATYFDSAGTLRTAVINYSTWSQAISNWGAKPDSTLVDNSAVSPDGTVNATLVTEGSAGTAQVQSTVVTGLPAGSTLTYSMYVKRGNTDWLEIIPSDSGTTNGATTWFNTATGLFGTVTPRGAATGITTGVTAAGNGWYRLRWTLTQPGTSTSFGWTFRTATADNSITRVANGTYYVWGVQVEIAGAVGVYVPTGAAGSGAPRFDYDPNSKQMRGLLIEEARTNLVVASGAMGAAPWTAASPTTWGPPGADPAGTTNAALFIPANVTAIHQVYSPAITIAAGATYCLSCFVKAAGQRYGGLQLAIAGNGTGFRVGWDTATGAITIAVAFGTGTVAASGIQACPNGWFRVWVIGTVSATDTSVFCIYAPVAASGNAPTASQPGDGVNGQYFWGAQVEAGAFPTSYIPTTSAAVTRAVDAASIPGTYAQSGSLVSDFTLTNPAANTVVVSIGKAATLSNDSLTLRSFGTLPATMQGISFANNVNSGGVQTSNTYAQGTNAKLGMTYTPTAMTVCLNAGTVAPAVLTAIPATLDTISVAIGRLVATGTGWTRRIRYWNRVLSNAELQQVTS